MRGKELIEKRDKAIVEMFYNLYDVKRRRLDDVLNEMSQNHFFLDTKYIYAIIMYNKTNKDYYFSLCEGKTKKPA